LTAATAGDLPDVNVWLALAVQEHPHHRAARAYWQGAAQTRAWFCRITMLGLVRLLTQPRVMGDGAMAAHEAMAVHARWMALPEVGLHPEPPGCDDVLNGLVSPTLPARLLTDTYLAAFATAAGLRLVSFDADFQRFEALTLLRLFAPDK
jgi:uncharacterized protein